MRSAQALAAVAPRSIGQGKSNMTLNKVTIAIAAALAICAVGSQAHACSGGPFTGPYIGVNAGIGLNHASQTVPTNPEFTGSDYSGVIGAQLGYNRQCGNLILGVETDINYVRFDTTSAVFDPLGTVFLNDEIDWFGTVRGKLGIAIQPNAMLYATAGLAYAGVTTTVNQPPIFFQSNDETKVGWTIGGGLELVHFDRWLIKAEALYVDLGDTTRVYTLDPVGCGGAPCTARVTWDDSFLVARLGLSYKFGAREHVPLK
jgi:outer membrane immunogenic protein